MSNKHSLIIGVEEYPKGIRRIDYATKDAMAFSNAIVPLGFSVGNQTLLTKNHEAPTSGNVKYRIQDILKNAEEHDEVYIYFSGHGARDSGVNYLLLSDTRIDAIPLLGIPMSYLLEETNKSKCKRVVIFLDCCHAESDALQSKSILEHMTSTELEQFFQGSEYKIAFASCSSNQSSFLSDNLKHSIWTYYLLQAIQGKVPEILDAEHRLLSSKLQDYLKIRVAETAQKEHGEKQQPKLYGSSDGNFIIADLKHLFKSQSTITNLPTDKIHKIKLVSKTTDRIRNLTNFNPRLKVYPTINKNTRAFVSSLGHPEAEAEAEKLLNSATKIFNFKLGDIDQDPDSDWPVIKCRYFEASFYIEQNEENASEYVLEINVDIPTIKTIEDDDFNEVFERNNFDLVLAHSRISLNVGLI